MSLDSPGDVGSRSLLLWFLCYLGLEKPKEELSSDPQLPVVPASGLQVETAKLT